MKLGIKMIALGVVAALAIGGIALVLMNQEADDVNALANKAPVVSIVSNADEDAVLVTAMVDGESVPMSGIQVTICKMNMSSDGNQTAMRVMEAVTLQSGDDGKVRFQFQEGEKYIVCAENHNQYGYANRNMNQTEAQECYQHEWNWEHMEGQSFRYANQAMTKA